MDDWNKVLISLIYLWRMAVQFLKMSRYYYVAKIIKLELIFDKAAELVDY